MENILIVLAIIGSVIYKMYTGYKEEMEKAAKRKQQPRPQVVPPRPTARPTQIPAPSTPKKTVSPVTQYDEQKVPSEVKRVQQSRAERALKKVTVLEEKKDNERKPFEFDLRQAVIQSAILERPYQP